jgi:hypothetical protein
LPEAGSHGLRTNSPPPLPVQTRGRQRARRDTLEVPPMNHHNPLHIHSPEATIPTMAMSGGRSSPPSLKDDGDDGGDHATAPRTEQATASSAVSSSPSHTRPAFD